MYRFIFLLFLILLLIFASTLHSRIIHVPSDSTTIQGGINGAVDGDTVLVADGTYTGDGNRDIDFLGKAIVLMSENGPVNCVIDCQGSASDPHRAFYFHSGEGLDSVLRGFTITGGYRWDFPNDEGGAIYCNGSSPTIEGNVITENEGAYGAGIFCELNADPVIDGNTFSGNNATMGGAIFCADTYALIITNNTISGNSASTDGGGIHCHHSDPDIADNDIRGNSATNRYGGGIYIDYFSNPVVTGNEIMDNTAGSHGGGIYIDWYCSVNIENNRISGNIAGSMGLGGGIHCSESSPTIHNNSIVDNSAFSGGGIYCEWMSSPDIEGNTIAMNTAPYGAGLYCYSLSDPTITNSTFTENFSSGNGPAIYCYDNCFPVVMNSILWGDTAGTGGELYYDGTSLITVSYSDVEGGWTGVGNIDQDPLFGDPEYHLHFTSPCIDAGDSSILDACRPPGFGEDRSDMGAYGGAENCGWLEGTIDLLLSSGDSVTVSRGDTLYFRTLIWNSTDNEVAGDYWLSVLLPNSNEIVIPENFLNYSNPLSGQVPAHGSLTLSNELYIPMGVSTGSYFLIGRIGIYPNTIIDEESFGFWVVE